MYTMLDRWFGYLVLFWRMLLIQLQKQGELRYQCASKNKVVSNYSTTLKKARVDQDLTNVSILQDSNFNCTSSACGGLDTVIDKVYKFKFCKILNSIVLQVSMGNTF